jgi:hypothetical protein
MRICISCSKEIGEDRGILAIYCSKVCQQKTKSHKYYLRVKKGKKRERKIPKKCEYCGKDFKGDRHSLRFCSSKCVYDSRRKYLSIPDCLEEASRKLDKTIGYVRVYCPMHPHANTWGYVYEHRLIIEGMIGRFLEKVEHVHHKNGKRWDNSPENLEVLYSSDHAKKRFT